MVFVKNDKRRTNRCFWYQPSKADHVPYQVAAILIDLAKVTTLAGALVDRPAPKFEVASQDNQRVWG